MALRVEQPVTMESYAGLKPAWCPGCGNFGILRALNKALVEMKVQPWQLLMVSGIGQAGKLPHYSRGNTFNSLHGRAVPPAVAAKIANPELVVIVIGGDGDGYSEGGNHFLHVLRRNHDITHIVHDNQVYALTKGQASPTSDEGYVSKTTPGGALPPLNALGVAIMAGATFVARTFAGDLDHAARTIQEGVRHRGFALIDVLQPCVTFNHVNTFKWYSERVYKLDERGHNPQDKMAALEVVQQWGERIPIGVIYREQRPTYEDRIPALKKGPLAKQVIDPQRIAPLFQEFQ
ncbi:MAG: 2-oxoacid:ferredoxin oxidoreductase subunit beta [Chloroflexi bacterium]|nr:2-oxoacid:ferredoxin oxidoreductase subunit beta [Chloroflexota bacterium]